MDSGGHPALHKDSGGDPAHHKDSGGDPAHYKGSRVLVAGVAVDNWYSVAAAAVPAEQAG